jgi:predicted Zn-dependent protease
MSAQKETDKSGAKLPVWLSTHPAGGKRVGDLEAFMPQVVPVYEANKGRFQ